MKYDISKIKEEFAMEVIGKLQEIDSFLKEFNPKTNYYIYSLKFDELVDIHINDEKNVAIFTIYYDDTELVINGVTYNYNYGKNNIMSKARLEQYLRYLVNKIIEYSFVQNYNLISDKKEKPEKKSEEKSQVEDKPKSEEKPKPIEPSVSSTSTTKKTVKK